jgi:hypothetical protein
MRSVIAVACSMLAAGCLRLKPARTPLRADQGTRVRKTWCDPSRGLPADPSLGVLQPLRFGVGSIIHERDGTTESFAAERAFTQLIKLPERQVEVSVVDHPSDVDYSVMGTMSGDIVYAREAKFGAVGWGGFALGMTGYIVGGSMFGTTLLIEAVDGKDHGTLMNASLLVLAAGLTGQVMVATRPSNRYTWDQSLHLTLRRGTIVIGEIEIQDVHDRIQWAALDQPRAAASAQLWARAAQEVTSCVAADLANTPQVTAQVSP